MNTQNSNKSCANCKHWFLNPHVEYGDLTKAEGRCLASDTFTRSDSVCNAWEQSMLYDIDKPVGACAHWVMITERLPNKSGLYLSGLINHWGEPYTNEVYFDAENIRPHWNINDEVYCWLDEMPELPKPPEDNE